MGRGGDSGVQEGVGTVVSTAGILIIAVSSGTLGHRTTPKSSLLPPPAAATPRTCLTEERSPRLNCTYVGCSQGRCALCVFGSVGFSYLWFRIMCAQAWVQRGL